MGEWHRLTREIMATALSPEMATALQDHITQFGIRIPLDECVMCVETVSEKKRGLLGRRGRKRTTLDALITPEWFVIIVGEGDSVVAATMTVRLNEATVTDFKDSPLFQKIPDNGLHVSGLFTGRVGMQGSASTESFVPLGDGPVADRFKRTLAAAVQTAKS